MKPGCLLRTGKLSDMTERDRKLLSEEYHVTEIIDLRTGAECAGHPDRELPGAVWRWNPILPDKAMGITREEEEAADPLEKKVIFLRSLHGRSEEYMRKIYPMMVQEEECIEHLKSFYELLDDHEEGAFLWHCTMGKDRTGLTAALLLWALGASREDILADYVATNEALRDFLDRTAAQIREYTGDESLVREAVKVDSVDISFLEAVFDTLEAEYGSVERFLEERLGLSGERRCRLIEKYTCPAAL